MDSGSDSRSCDASEASSSSKKDKKGLQIEGYPIEGLSIGGQETCVIFPSLKVAFDIGKCPQRAVSQDFLFISHGHMDHIGGLPMYVATRELYRMKPPTIFVPKCIKESVERLLEVHREMNQSELKNNLIGIDVGEEFYIRKDLKVKAFRTYHAIQSQGYIIYHSKQKLKSEYVGLSGNEIKNLRLSGVEVTYTITSPEVAFTGDTMSDFINDHNNTDVLKARILVMESTFVDSAMTIEDARDYGHTHLYEIANYAEKFENKAILLIHFSARYRSDGFCTNRSFLMKAYEKTLGFSEMVGLQHDRAFAIPGGSLIISFLGKHIKRIQLFPEAIITHPGMWYVFISELREKGVWHPNNMPDQEECEINMPHNVGTFILPYVLDA